MKASELNATHIGQRIRFKLDGSPQVPADLKVEIS